MVNEINLPIHTNPWGTEHYILKIGFYVLLNDTDYALKIVEGNFSDGLGAYLHRVDLSRSYVTSSGQTVIQSAKGEDSYFIQQLDFRRLAKVELDAIHKKELGQGVLW